MIIKYTDKYLKERRDWYVVKGSEFDLGIDLPANGYSNILQPGEVRLIDTGISFEFPMFGKLRRLWYKIILGMDITGIGGLVWPRGRHETHVLAGVIDPGYRGTIKVKLHNPTDHNVVVNDESGSAQIVPVLCIHMKPRFVREIDDNTERGKRGGINNQ